MTILMPGHRRTHPHCYAFLTKLCLGLFQSQYLFWDQNPEKRQHFAGWNKEPLTLQMQGLYNRHF